MGDSYYFSYSCFLYSRPKCMMPLRACRDSTYTHPQISAQIPPSQGASFLNCRLSYGTLILSIIASQLWDFLIKSCLFCQTVNSVRAGTMSVSVFCFYNGASEDLLAKSNFRFLMKSKVGSKALLERPSSSKGAPSAAQMSVCRVPAWLSLVVFIVWPTWAVALTQGYLNGCLAFAM